jgi:SAM-dependent methyltransferase
VSDIQDLRVPGELETLMGNRFDAAFSNAALHWCKENPAGVLESVKSVLKPGGRFVAEMGGFMNCVGETS